MINISFFIHLFKQLCPLSHTYYNSSSVLNLHMPGSPEGFYPLRRFIKPSADGALGIQGHRLHLPVLKISRFMRG